MHKFELFIRFNLKCLNIAIDSIIIKENKQNKKRELRKPYEGTKTKIIAKREYKHA